MTIRSGKIYFRWTRFYDFEYDEAIEVEEGERVTFLHAVDHYRGGDLRRVMRSVGKFFYTASEGTFCLRRFRERAIALCMGDLCFHSSDVAP